MKKTYKKITHHILLYSIIHTSLISMSFNLGPISNTLNLNDPTATVFLQKLNEAKMQKKANMISAQQETINAMILQAQAPILQEQQKTASRILNVSFASLPFTFDNINEVIQNAIKVTKAKTVNGVTYYTSPIDPNNETLQKNEIVYGYSNGNYIFFYIKKASPIVFIGKLDAQKNVIACGYSISASKPISNDMDFIFVNVDKAQVESIHVSGLANILLKIYYDSLPSVTVISNYSVNNPLVESGKIVFVVIGNELRLVYIINSLTEPVKALNDLSLGLHFYTFDNRVSNDEIGYSFLAFKESQPYVVSCGMNKNIPMFLGISGPGYLAGLSASSGSSMMFYSVYDVQTYKVLQVRSYMGVTLEAVGIPQELADGNYLVSMIDAQDMTVSYILIVDSKGECINSWQITRSESGEVIAKLLFGTNDNYDTSISVINDNYQFNLSVKNATTPAVNSVQNISSAKLNMGIDTSQVLASSQGIISEKTVRFSENLNRMSNYCIKNSFSTSDGRRYVLF